MIQCSSLTRNSNSNRNRQDDVSAKDDDKADVVYHGIEKQIKKDTSST